MAFRHTTVDPANFQGRTPVQSTQPAFDINRPRKVGVQTAGAQALTKNVVEIGMCERSIPCMNDLGGNSGGFGLQPSVLHVRPVQLTAGLDNVREPDRSPTTKL